MGLIRTVLYTGLAVFANAAGAGEAASTAALEALREGGMKKLAFHAPQEIAEAEFGDLDGGRRSLAEFRGKWVLLNFWATWCAPCRKEMPTLSALQADLGGDSFAVVTIATGRNSPQGIRRFFEETGVTNLPLFVDPDHALARPMGVFGLPVTMILDPGGREVARMMGEADWNGASARAILAELMAHP